MKPSSILIALVCLFLTWMACDEPVNVTDVTGSDDHPLNTRVSYSGEVQQIFFMQKVEHLNSTPLPHRFIITG